jgi:hypothetical protein
MAWCLVKHRNNFTFTFTFNLPCSIIHRAEKLVGQWLDSLVDLSFEVHDVYDLEQNKNATSLS